MDLFPIKKIVSRFLFPLPVCIEILLAGVFLLWFTRHQKSGRVLVTAGTGLLLLLSYDAPSESLLRGLEHQYGRLTPSALSELQAGSPDRGVKWIVVLGGGTNPDPDLPISSRLAYSSVVRLIEGIRLYRENKGSKLIVSGGGAEDRSRCDAALMSELARTLGVPQQDIIEEDQSRDTEDEALFIKPLVKDDAFILVTSASHMPRSMRLFAGNGMKPIPAPTDYLTSNVRIMPPDAFFPDPQALDKATRAVYEYLGLAWLRLRNSAQ
jgi:uncharacterized SAM-binding protein YcdF (DUF218 family)